MSQIKGRESITHSLKMELQQNEWRNIINIAKCNLVSLESVSIRRWTKEHVF